MTTATARTAYEGVYDADPAHSSFEAGARHMGVGTFRTRFEDVSARLTAEGGALRLDGAALVESIAIRTPPEFREHVVYGEDFFDAKRHPAIRFSSDDVVLDGGRATLRGRLTIKDVTREIVAGGTYREPIEDPYGAMRAALDLSATIDRRDFGLGWQARLPGGGDALGWTVAIDVHLELIGR